MDKNIYYEQSAGYGYEKKLGNLHSDPTRLHKIFDVLCRNLSAVVSVYNTVSIADFGGGNGFLLRWIIEQLELNYPLVEFSGTVIDFNKKQLSAVDPHLKVKNIDIRSLECNRSFNIVLLRDVFHYLPQNDGLIVAQNIYNSLIPGGFCINVFPLSSKLHQSEINLFWTNFANIVARTKWSETKISRYYYSTEEMMNLFLKSGFRQTCFNEGYLNKAFLYGKNGFEAKYPSLTKADLKEIEDNFQSLSYGARKELTQECEQHPLCLSQEVAIMLSSW